MDCSAETENSGVPMKTILTYSLHPLIRRLSLITLLKTLTKQQIAYIKYGNCLIERVTGQPPILGPVVS